MPVVVPTALIPGRVRTPSKSRNQSSQVVLISYENSPFIMIGARGYRHLVDLTDSPSRAGRLRQQGPIHERIYHASLYSSTKVVAGTARRHAAVSLAHPTLAAIESPDGMREVPTVSDRQRYDVVKVVLEFQIRSALRYRAAEQVRRGLEMQAGHRHSARPQTHRRSLPDSDRRQSPLCSCEPS